MGGVQSKRTTDNHLELYLNDVYDKECVYKAEKEEVDFLMTGIEALVQKIVDLVLEEFSLRKETYEILESFYLHESLVEVYFPIKHGSKLERFVGVLKCKKMPIIKVGSFYEDTKNNFPDEFDIIFLLFCVQGNINICQSLYRAQLLHLLIKTITSQKKEYFKHSSFDGTRKLYFDQYITVNEERPASKLRFVYDNGLNIERYIHVDIVPACKIIVGKYLLHVPPKSFRREVRAARNCFCVNGRLAFTETEVHFIRNVLSQKHVKVYRILKFLINGNGDYETLELFIDNFFFSSRTSFSSYQIKIMMIYHHDECTNTDELAIGHCVIQILKQMCKYKLSTFPSLYSKNFCSDTVKFCVLHDLRKCIETLKSMQCLRGGYDYEKMKMKSVSRQYLDHLDRNDPENAQWFNYLETLGKEAPSYASLETYLYSIKEDISQETSSNDE